MKLVNPKRILLYTIISVSITACNSEIQENHPESRPIQYLTFDTGDIPISYRKTGSGEPVILLHGALIDAASNWSLATDSLAPFWEVVSLDLRGHGQSGKPRDPEAYGAELYLDVLRLMDHLQIESAHLVGYSLGGQLALNIAVKHPDRVRSLTMGGAGWAPPDSMASGEAFAQALENSDSVADVLAPDSSTYPAEVRAVLDANDVVSSAAMARGPWHEIGIAAAELAALPITIHVIVGELDPIRPQIEQLQTVLPATTVEILPALNHTTTFLSPDFAHALVRRLRDVD